MSLRKVRARKGNAQKRRLSILLAAGSRCSISAILLLMGLTLLGCNPITGAC
jgi:hypothetical protein